MRISVLDHHCLIRLFVLARAQRAFDFLIHIPGMYMCVCVLLHETNDADVDCGFCCAFCIHQTYSDHTEYTHIAPEQHTINQKYISTKHPYTLQIHTQTSTHTFSIIQTVLLFSDESVLQF